MLSPFASSKPATWKSSRLVASTCIVAILLISIAASTRAEHTRHWRQSTYDEFLKGTAHGIAVRSDGHLELAPKLNFLADADASYLWSIKLDKKGTAYAAGGSPARVFRFDGSQKPVTVFESTDLSAQAIAFDSAGALYVATSPDGKVYKVSSSGEKQIFFDPKSKYIWDLAFAADGTLYVATGDKGQIFAVAPSGAGHLFYSSEEAHIRVLAFDQKSNLLAGTEPNGRIVRITADKNQRADSASAKAAGFVLLETAKREVTGLTVAANGTIYASAIGEKQHAGQAPSAVITSPQGTTTIISGGIVNATPGQSGGAPFNAFPPSISSSIYSIKPDGESEEIWSSRDDVVYALGLATDGRVIAGTGNNGALLAIDGRGVFAQLAKTGSAQITGIAKSPDGKIFLCAANPGKLFSLGPEFESEGTYESRTFDAQLLSQWGRLDWFSSTSRAAATTAAASKNSKNKPHLQFFVRSGNTEEPNSEWSSWSGPFTSASPAATPPARYAQWKAVLHDGAGNDQIDWVSLAYLPRNVAPIIDGIAIQDPGVRAQSTLNLQSGQLQSVALKLPSSPNTSGVVIVQNSSPAKFEQPPQGTLQKGYQSVLWSAHDDNDDDLRFAIYYRAEDEHEWKLLKDKLDQKFYSWDSTAMPDGAYYLKITASDELTNPPDQSRKAERESDRFEIDNTPPVISALEAKPLRAAVTIKFTARDSSSSIERAQYSVDGGEWTTVSPQAAVSDALEESYEFSLDQLPAGEHSVAVRAYDRFENVGSAKTTFVVGSKN